MPIPGGPKLKSPIMESSSCIKGSGTSTESGERQAETSSSEDRGSAVLSSAFGVVSTVSFCIGAGGGAPKLRLTVVSSSGAIAAAVDGVVAGRVDSGRSWARAAMVDDCKLDPKDAEDAILPLGLGHMAVLDSAKDAGTRAVERDTAGALFSAASRAGESCEKDMEKRRLLLRLVLSSNDCIGSEAIKSSRPLPTVGDCMMLVLLPGCLGFLMLDQPCQSCSRACVLGIGSCDSFPSGRRCRPAAFFGSA